jgi:hypothetical protein
MDPLEEPLATELTMDSLERRFLNALQANFQVCETCLPQFFGLDRTDILGIAFCVKMHPSILIQGYEPIQKSFQSGALQKTGVQKNNFSHPSLPSPIYFCKDTLQRKRLQSQKLLMIITIGTPMNASADRLQPQDVLHVSIQVPRKERGW